MFYSSYSFPYPRFFTRHRFFQIRVSERGIFRNEIPDESHRIRRETATFPTLFTDQLSHKQTNAKPCNEWKQTFAALNRPAVAAMFCRFLKFMALRTAEAIQRFTGILLVPCCIINQRITGVGMGTWWKDSFNDYHKEC